MIQPLRGLIGSGNSSASICGNSGGRSNVPVLVLRGADSDFLLPGIVTRMQSSGPPTEVVEIEGSGHVPTLMREHHIAPILDFLARAAPAPRARGARTESLVKA